MRKKVLILSNHFITLYNFRKELIQRLLEEGHEVILSMPASPENTYFSNLGCEIIETEIERRGIDPVKDINLIITYIKIMRRIKPDIIFSYTIKPNIYGAIASNLTRNKQISNITGTGATFLNDSFISKIARVLYKVSIKHSYKVFFQNAGDRDYFIKHKMVKENYNLLPGSGVNLQQYQFCELPPCEQINFIFIGRVMKVKGIDEYLECAKVVKQKHPNASFYVAGFIEEDSYKEIIDDYHKRNIITYIGFQKNINSWIKKCHCTVLPSHGGEGIPNVLLESAAMGRICIASNINGSREVVEHEVTGYLYNTSNVEDLINKVTQLLGVEDIKLKQMGRMGRKLVEDKFNRKIVIERYLNEL